MADDLVQQYRFKVRTGDGREVVSPTATVSHPSLIAAAQPKVVAGVAPNLSMVFAEVPVKQILVAVKGQAQGGFASDGGFTDRAGAAGVHQISTDDFSFAVRSPRDPQSGQSTGRRLHLPVTFSKENGPSTPQFLQALANNETLPVVIFDCYGLDTTGQLRLAHCVRLTNASVSAVEFRQLDVRDPDYARYGDMVEISLTFQKVEVTHGSRVAEDDWG